MHDDGITLVFLTQGKVAIIDRADAERVLAYKWRYLAGGYAIRSGRKAEGLTKRDTVYMHRWLLNVPAGFEPDHINRNKLDNRRCNLRGVTRTQNSVNSEKRTTNTSGFKGVCLDKGKYWFAHIRVSGRKMRIGTFATAEEAARAYDKAAREHFGEYAFVNFPD